MDLYSKVNKVWNIYEDTIVEHAKEFGTNKLPNFLVLAPSKCATTWLAEKLSKHPQIGMPRNKESRYFDTFWMLHGLDWYSDSFTILDAKARGEACPSYCLLPLKGLAFLRKHVSDLKFVVSLRDPVQRTWSHIKHNFRFKVGSFQGRSDNQSIADIPEDVWLPLVVEGPTWWNSTYYNFLERWLLFFPRKQFHFVFMEKIKENGAEEFLGILDFLNINSKIDLGPLALDTKSFEGVALDLPLGLEKKMRAIFRSPLVKTISMLENTLNVLVPDSWRHSLEYEFERDPFVVSSPDRWPVVFDNGVFWVASSNFFRNTNGEVLLHYQGRRDIWISTESALHVQAIIRTLEFLQLSNSKLAAEEIQALVKSVTVEDEIHYIKYFAKDLFAEKGSRTFPEIERRMSS